MIYADMDLDQENEMAPWPHEGKTAAACQDAIAARLRRSRRWISVAELTRWMAEVLELSTNQGLADLRVLVRKGLIEKEGRGAAGTFYRAGR